MNYLVWLLLFGVFGFGCNHCGGSCDNGNDGCNRRSNGCDDNRGVGSDDERCCDVTDVRDGFEREFPQYPGWKDFPGIKGRGETCGCEEQKE